MKFTEQELIELKKFDALIDSEPEYLLPIERIVQEQTDREARWSAMDNKTACKAKKAYEYRQKHAIELSKNRRLYYEEHKQTERAQNKAWYEKHKNDPEQIERRHANYAIRKDNYQGIRDRPVKTRVELIAEQIMRSDNRRVRRYAKEIMEVAKNGRTEGT